MKLLLLASRTLRKASTKKPKAFHSSSIWWKWQNPNQTDRIFWSRTGTSTLYPSRILLHRTNTRRIPASGKITRKEQTWIDWKKKFCAAYAEKQRGEKSRDNVDQTFGGVVEPIPMEDSLPAGPNEILDSLSGYLDNILVAATNIASTQGSPWDEHKKEKGYIICNGNIKQSRGMPQLHSGGKFSSA